MKHRGSHVLIASFVIAGCAAKPETTCDAQQSRVAAAIESSRACLVEAVEATGKPDVGPTDISKACPPQRTELEEATRAYLACPQPAAGVGGVYLVLTTCLSDAMCACKDHACETAMLTTIGWMGTVLHAELGEPIFSDSEERAIQAVRERMSTCADEAGSR